jgi:hypothetical protein
LLAEAVGAAADTLGEVAVATLEAPATLEGFTAGLAAAESLLWRMDSTDRSRRGSVGDGVWHHDDGWSHHPYPGYYGYSGSYDYGLDDYSGPYYDDSDSFDVQPAPSNVAPDESASLIMSVQKELAQLGYYHGPIDGVAGSETERAVRWFQSIDHLPVTGQIDSATQQALRIA